MEPSLVNTALPASARSGEPLLQPESETETETETGKRPHRNGRSHAPSPDSEVRVDLSRMVSEHGWRNKLGRLIWSLTWMLLFRPSPRICHGWRCLILEWFGARIGRDVRVYPSAKIWAPWNLTMEDHSCLGPDVDCYCVAPIRIGAHAMVSQYTYLCTASHDYEHPHLPLVTAPIDVQDSAWVTADVFVAPGVTIGEGSVVGARSSVFKDVKPWSVVAGHPARFIKRRILKPA